MPTLFLPIAPRFTKLETEVSLIRSRIGSISVGGTIRFDPGNVIGSVPIHTHEGLAQGGYIHFASGASGHIDWEAFSILPVGLPATGKSLRNFGVTGAHSLAAIYADGSIRAVEMETGAGPPTSLTRKIGSHYFDSTNFQYWINNNGSTGWTLIGPSYSARADASGDLTLTNAYQDIPGLSITVPNAGTYVLVYSCRLDRDASGKIVTIQAVVDGVADAMLTADQDAIGAIQQIAGVVRVTTTGTNKIVKLQAKQSTTGGVYAIKASQSTMVIHGNGASAAATGGTIVVQEDDATVDANATTLDFTEPDATLVSSSPAGEANINMALYALLGGRAGGQQVKIDSARGSYFLGLTAGNPGLNWDANDWEEYNEASNYFRWLIGSVEKLRIDANGDLTLARYINTSKIAAGLLFPVGTDGDMFVGLTAGNPGFNVDSNDWIDFVRASNLYRFNIGASVKFDIASDGTIHPRGDITMDSGKLVDGVDVSALTGVANQTANTGFMGPASGGAASPGFRALVAADIPVATLFSFHNYTNVPDAAVGATIVVGDQQGIIHHSGPVAETATKLYADAETAPGASGLPVTWKYGDTDDLDTVASWTTIATLTLSSEKSSNTSSMTNASIPANRLIQCNVGTVVGTPKDATSSLRVKRPLSA